MYYIYVLVQAATQRWNPLLRAPKIDVTPPYGHSDTVGVFQSASVRDQVIPSPVHIFTSTGQSRFITTRRTAFTVPFERVARLAEPDLSAHPSPVPSGYPLISVVQIIRHYFSKPIYSVQGKIFSQNRCAE